MNYKKDLKMNISESKISKLIEYYSLANTSQLANKPKITPWVISNWKIRNEIGALTDTVFNKGLKSDWRICQWRRISISTYEFFKELIIMKNMENIWNDLSIPLFLT